jgi:hypothetical protein
MSSNDELRSRLEAAHYEALRVHDSPVRADELVGKRYALLAGLDAVGVAEDTTARLRSALESAVRVLRREEDGREAARHLSTALGLLEPRPRRPSPFLDD